MTRMGRPPKADRDAVFSKGLSLKLSERDREMLARLLEARRAELLAQTGEHVPLTAASLIRSMIYREAKARGLTGESESEPASGSVPPPAPSPSPSPPKKKERSR
jgi:hypothetical protein